MSDTVCLECGKFREGKTFPLCKECQTKRNNAKPFRKEGIRKKAATPEVDHTPQSSPAMSEIFENVTTSLEDTQAQMEKMYYTTRQAGAVINRSMQSILRYIDRGDFEYAKKIGGQWFLQKNEVDKMAEDFPTVEEALIKNGRKSAQRLAGKRSAKPSEAKQDKGMAAAIAKHQSEQEKHLAWILAGCPK